MKLTKNQTTLLSIIVTCLLVVFVFYSFKKPQPETTPGGYKKDPISQEQYKTNKDDVYPGPVRNKLGFAKLINIGLSDNQRRFITKTLDQYFFKDKKTTLIRIKHDSVKYITPNSFDPPYITFKVYLNDNNKYYLIKFTKNKFHNDKNDLLEIKNQNKKLLKSFERTN